MEKIFEDEFMDWQADMVHTAKEFIDNRSEKIYLYGSIESGRYFFNLFFKIKNQVVFMSQVNSVLNANEQKIDISGDRQDMVLRIGLEDLQKVEEVCKKYDQAIPTQLKLFYDVTENSLKTKYQYDFIYSNNNDLDTQDIFMSWYEDIKKEVEG